MNKETRLILKDADENTPGETEVVIQWTTKGIDIRPVGTGVKGAVDGAPIFLERYKGHVRVLIWGDINSENPTHNVSLAGAWESLEGQPEGHLGTAIPATYHTKWDDGREISSSCLYDPVTCECFDIEITDEDTGEASLEEEWVTVGDLRLTANEGVTFRN